MNVKGTKKKNQVVTEIFLNSRGAQRKSYSFNLA